MPEAQSEPDPGGDPRMSMLSMAKSIAHSAHHGQYRKFGSKGSYITHPEAVAEAVEGKMAKAVAWVHDVVEDTDWTFARLLKYLPASIVDAVECLTKREGEPYKEFVLRAMKNNLARRVKIADIEHNMSTIPEGHGLIDRYEKALVVLKGEAK